MGATTGDWTSSQRAWSSTEAALRPRASEATGSAVADATSGLGAGSSEAARLRKGRGAQGPTRTFASMGLTPTSPWGGSSGRPARLDASRRLEAAWPTESRPAALPCASRNQRRLATLFVSTSDWIRPSQE